MSESLDWQEYLTLLLFKAKNAAYLISHFESRLALTSWVFPPRRGSRRCGLAAQDSC